MRMNTSWMVIVLSTLLTQGLLQAQGGPKPAAPTSSQEGFVFAAAKMDKAAVIDGAADKAEYPSRAMVMKQTPEREAIQGVPASARVFHDGKMLYVAITVPFKSAAGLSKGEGWGTNDGAEVCLRDASAAKPGPTFIVHGFASGKHECTTDAGAPSEAVEKLDKAVKFAAQADKQSWTGEFGIPFEASGIRYKAGMSLGFNAGVWRSESAEWIVWRGAQGPTYELDNGGKLTLE